VTAIAARSAASAYAAAVGCGGWLAPRYSWCVNPPMTGAVPCPAVKKQGGHLTAISPAKPLLFSRKEKGCRLTRQRRQVGWQPACIAAWP
jgi:hypothetical protein